MAAARFIRLFIVAFTSSIWVAIGSPVQSCQTQKDYANIKPEGLGVKPVARRIDNKTGFIVGAVNKSSLITKLKSINGIPVEELEKSMRPSELSRAGFLGKDESLLKIMAEDNDWVSSSALTHQELAGHLRVLAAIGRREKGAFTYNGVRFKVQLNVFDGFQDSPFKDGTKTNVNVILLNLDSKDGLKFSGLIPAMVERYGFYEGRGTSYRVDPKDIVRVLTFLRPQKGDWVTKGGKLESVTFDYGTVLTAKDVDRISAYETIARFRMGYAAIDSEYVEIEGDLLKLSRLQNLEEVYLCKEGIRDEDLNFVALLPKLRILEFNADNGEGKSPVCTDQCGDYLRLAKTLRHLVIHDGKFTDEFVAKITKGLPHLETLQLNSADLTDKSLQLIADRCQNLKSLIISSDHFTPDGVKKLNKLMVLGKKAVSSPELRKQKL